MSLYILVGVPVVTMQKDRSMELENNQASDLSGARGFSAVSAWGWVAYLTMG